MVQSVNVNYPVSYLTDKTWARYYGANNLDANNGLITGLFSTNMSGISAQPNVQTNLPAAGTGLGGSVTVANQDNIDAARTLSFRNEVKAAAEMKKRYEEDMNKLIEDISKTEEEINKAQDQLADALKAATYAGKQLEQNIQDQVKGAISNAISEAKNPANKDKKFDSILKEKLSGIGIDTSKIDNNLNQADNINNVINQLTDRIFLLNNLADIKQNGINVLVNKYGKLLDNPDSVSVSKTGQIIISKQGSGGPAVTGTEGISAADMTKFAGMSQEQITQELTSNSSYKTLLSATGNNAQELAKTISILNNQAQMTDTKEGSFNCKEQTVNGIGISDLNAKNAQYNPKPVVSQIGSGLKSSGKGEQVSIDKADLSQVSGEELAAVKGVDLSQKLPDGTPMYVVAKGRQDGLTHIYKYDGSRYLNVLGAGQLQMGNNYLRVNDMDALKAATANATCVQEVKCGYCTSSPLILDTDHDGKVEAQQGIGVDIDGNGLADGAAVGGDKMLAMGDLNGDGQITGTEVFGDQTIDPFTGKKLNAANGFEALRMVAESAEKNTGMKCINNGQVDVQALKSALEKSGKGSLGLISDNNVFKLESLGSISKINVANYQVDEKASGDVQHRQLGSFTETDGNIYKIDDVWFRLSECSDNKTESIAKPVDNPTFFGSMSNPRAYFDMRRQLDQLVKLTKDGAKLNIQSADKTLDEARSFDYQVNKDDKEDKKKQEILNPFAMAS